MNDLTLLTYTHSKVSDLHRVYFDRIDSYFGINNQMVMCNQPIDRINSENIFLYDNNGRHYEQMVACLSLIKTKYLIYSQEDYILYDRVKINKINQLIGLMNSDNNISFIRLINSGIDFERIDYNNDLFYLNPDHGYYYSTQITIWKTDDLKGMFIKSKVDTIWNEPQNSIYLKNLGKIGLCVKEKGNKVGGHFNSSIYPYIATALVNGKWNESEYLNELALVFSEYNIDKNIRGVR